MKIDLCVVRRIALNLAFAALAALPATAQAGKRDAILSLIGRASSVTDLKSESNEAPPIEFGSTYEVELGLRIRGPFQFIMVSYRTDNSLRNGYGAGFRVDTPGFFWIGGKDGGRRSARNWPVNTSIFGVVMQSFLKNESGTTDSTLDSQMGLAMDIYLFNRYVFLTAQGAILTAQGNSFTVASGGLGIEF